MKLYKLHTSKIKGVGIISYIRTINMIHTSSLYAYTDYSFRGYSMDVFNPIEQ